MSNLFNEIICSENVEEAYRLCMQGKTKFKVDAILFDKDKTYNINMLISELKNKTYKMSEYTEFYVYEPKQRKIYAPCFRDKLVQMMINNIVKEMFNKSFIFDSYACIDSKGTHKSAERIQNFIKRASFEYGKGAFIIKIDIKKFFYSIDREVLKTFLPKMIKCDLTLSLINLIIDSSPNELGLPLGNITSHMLANYYLHQVDVFIKRKLSVKYYVRYMDDMMIIVKDKEKAKGILNFVEKFINEILKLELNKKKTKISPVEQGVNMVGYKIYKTHRLLRNDSKKKIKRKMKKIPDLIFFNKITKEKSEQMLNSWLGHARNCCSYNFISKLINKHNYIKIDKQGTLKINEEVIYDGFKA